MIYGDFLLMMIMVGKSIVYGDLWCFFLMVVIVGK